MIYLRNNSRIRFFIQSLILFTNKLIKELIIAVGGERSFKTDTS